MRSWQADEAAEGIGGPRSKKDMSSKPGEVAGVGPSIAERGGSIGPPIARHTGKRTVDNGEVMPGKRVKVETGA